MTRYDSESDTRAGSNPRGGLPVPKLKTAEAGSALDDDGVGLGWAVHAARAMTMSEATNRATKLLGPR